MSATATSAAPGHPASAAIDGVKQTSWAVAPPGPGLNQSLTITLGRTVDLARVGITPGASDNQKAFLAEARPREILVTFPDGSRSLVTLRDIAAFQPFSVTAHGVTKVTLQILSVYPGQSNQRTAIDEVEFFTKR